MTTPLKRTLSAEEVQALAERAYPALEPSGFCSRHHPSQPPQVDCTVCYPDLNALIDAHNRLKQRAWAALADIRVERSHGATANSEYIDQRIAEGLSTDA